MERMNGPFNSDPKIVDEVKRIQKEFNIDIAFETGTYIGNTTRCLADIFKQVYTCDIEAKFLQQAKDRDRGIHNVLFTLGASIDVFRALLPLIPKDKTVFFYLDAHYFDPSSPGVLRDELDLIAENLYGRAVVMVDDFKVPNRTFQFDTWQGAPNDLFHSEDKVKKLCDSPFIYYNNKPGHPHPVGKMFILPKEKPEWIDCEKGHFYSNMC